MSTIQTKNNSTTKTQTESTSWLKNENLSFGLIISGIILILLAIVAFLWMDTGFSSTEQIKSDKWGQIGDFIGGIVGTLWALAGVLLFYLALTEQRKDTKINQIALTEQRKDTKINQKALALQIKALNQQVTEFELQTKELELQRQELISSRKVYEQQNKTIRTQQFESHFYSLLNLYLQIKDNLNNLDSNKDYFKSIYRKMVIEYSEPTDIVDHHEKMINSYVNLFNQERGHLSHFLKSFYRLIKIIDSNPFLNDNEKIQYSKILRSQLTDYEQLIMQYNSYSIYGVKARTLILTYNLLKHSPLFQKSEFEYYLKIQDNFNLLNFADYFCYYIVMNIKDSFEMDFENKIISNKDDIFNSLVEIDFSDDITIKITCEKDISKNGIKLSNDQYLKFIYNLVFEKIIFNTFTSPNKIKIAKDSFDNEDNRVFKITIDMDDDVVLNLHYDK